METPPPTKSERRQAFVREIASIVLGVLIALALGAVATEIGWRLDVAEAREALGLELGEILGQADERVSGKDCIESRLDQLGAVLDQAAASGQLPPLGNLGDPPFRTWSRGVWTSTVSADIASHMDRDTLDNLSSAYDFVDLIAREAQKENDAWTALFTMVGPGRVIAPAEVAELRAALTRARMANRMIVIGAVRTRQRADAYDLPYDRNTVAEYAGDRLKARYCAPLPAPDGKPYGQAPFATAYERMLANPYSEHHRSGFEATSAPAEKPDATSR
jgi:hypothetical protein